MEKHPRSKDMTAPGHPNKGHSSSHHSATTVAGPRGRDTIPGMAREGSGASRAKMCPEPIPGVGGKGKQGGA